MTEQEKAADAYKTGADQRDPQAVKSANASAAQSGSNSAGAERGSRR
jgi:hypothetical protein